MLSARPRIAPTQHRTPPGHERPQADDSTPAWGRVRGDAPPTPTVQPTEPARLTLQKQRSHCEPDALQACSRDAAHWVTVQSSRLAAALQAACSGAEGALPPETHNDTNVVGSRWGAQTGAHRGSHIGNPPHPAHAHRSVALKRSEFHGEGSLGKCAG